MRTIGLAEWVNTFEPSSSIAYRALQVPIAEPRKTKRRFLPNTFHVSLLRATSTYSQPGKNEMKDNEIMDSILKVVGLYTLLEEKKCNLEPFLSRI